MADDLAFVELLASYEAALDAVQRSLTIAKRFANAHSTGERLPASVLQAY